MTIEKANTLEKDGFQETKITMYSHTGTHIDILQCIIIEVEMF